jgi:hypothetical protein
MEETRDGQIDTVLFCCFYVYTSVPGGILRDLTANMDIDYTRAVAHTGYIYMQVR